MQLVPLASKPFYASATKRKIPKMTNFSYIIIPSKYHNANFASWIYPFCF